MTFALVVPGRPLRTDFKQVKPTSALMVVPKPAEIREFMFCLTKPLPQGQGVGLYYSLPPFKEWQYIGAVTTTYPTRSFHSPWKDKLSTDVAAIQLGVQLEALDVLKQKADADTKEDERTLDSAKGIAKNLYEYMASFSKTGKYANLPGDVLVIPTDVVDRWMKKFVEKHRRDPYFWMKKGPT
eukprot:gb/GEZN01018555.1/.p1 GENE.gb/GEZN01018555.1/~~gb/GEZN01018555.1/.p1  ORF type:complete len:183 (+),score=31.78 gb/GEZN01018555.1/:71-619(+)